MSDFDFDLVSEFAGYSSTRDKTNTSKAVLVRGSKNVYKKLSGTIASRPGLKTRGSADTTVAGVLSSYDWSTSLGSFREMRVANGKLQVESDIVTAGTYVWYDLMTALTLTRFVFSPWWDNTEKKDRLMFVKGDNNLHHWSGGMAILSAAAGNAIGLRGNSASLTTQSITEVATNVTVSSNGLAGLSAALAINLSGQPLNNETITLTLNATNIVITFVTVIGVNAGNVLIGATVADTVTNLLGLLTSPGSTTATQVALSGGNATLVGYLTPSATYTLTKTGSTSWAQAGFATNTLAEKTVVINGTTYTYTTGENGTTLGGVTPNPTGEAANSVVIQSVITEATTPSSSSLFTNDFIKVIGNRLHVGSYIGRIVYISSNTNFKDFTVPTPRTPGTPDLLILDNPAVGITVRNGNAHISAGDSDWYEISYSQITVGTTLTEVTKVDKKPSSFLGAAYAHEFIDTVGNDIIYLSKDQQVRVFGTFRNITQAKYPSISQQVQTEFKAENFTGGHLRCIGDFIHITAPVNGRDWMHQTRESVDPAGNVVSERLWHPPQIRNISRFAVINGVVFGHSNANPMIYQVWDTLQWSDDGPSGEPLPYTCVMRMSYRNYKGRRQGMTKFDKAYFEGYIANGSPLYGNVYFDYQGSSGLQNFPINTIKNPAQFFYGNSAPSLGTSPVGDNPLGDGLTPDSNEQELLNKYRKIANLNPINCFEYDMEVYSSDLDCRWEVLALGLNPVLSPTQPIVLQK